MSEQPTSPPPARPSGGRGNMFTQKIGPLPMWAWVGIAAAILVVWRVYSNKQQQSASQQATTTPSTPADQVPQFVNQTYTTVTAPSAPATPASKPPDNDHPPPGPFTPTPPSQPGPTTPVPVTPTTPHPAPRPATTVGSVTGLRASGAGATNVGLAWNPVNGAQRYQVRVTYQDKIVKTAFTNGTQYNVTGLSPNRTYGLHVVAINGNDWAPESSIVQKTT